MNGFPKVAGYYMNRGHGAPWLATDGRTGPHWSVAPLDLAAIRAAARASVITLDIQPIYAPSGPHRPDIVAEFRRANPRISILAYLCFRAWYGDRTVSRTGTVWAERWHEMLRTTGGLTPMVGSTWSWVNYANPATEQGAKDLLCPLAGSGLWDGMFHDFADDWTASAENQRAVERILWAVRQAGGPGFLMLGNGGERSQYDGIMREGYPDSLAISTPENVRVLRSGRPHKPLDWLQAGTGHFNPTNPDTQRAARFAHGFACLHDMLCSFGPDRDQTIPYHTWFFDFYDAGGRGVGWLGEPMGPATGTLGVWARMFSGGVVLVNDGTTPRNVTFKPGLCRFDGTEMGSVTVAAKDAWFLVRAR